MNKSLVIITFLILLSLVCYGVSYYVTLEKPYICNDTIYTDNLITAMFGVDIDYVTVFISNLSEYTIVIDWQKVYFTFPDGKDMRVLSGSSKCILNSKFQTPIILPPKKYFIKVIIPAEHVLESDFHRCCTIIRGLFWFTDELDNVRFKITFVLNINGEDKEYEFVFRLRKIMR